MLPMVRFEPGDSDIGSNRFANCATTTAAKRIPFIFPNVLDNNEAVQNYDRLLLPVQLEPAPHHQLKLLLRLRQVQRIRLQRDRIL